MKDIIQAMLETKTSKLQKLHSTKYLVRAYEACQMTSAGCVAKCSVTALHHRRHIPFDCDLVDTGARCLLTVGKACFPVDTG